MSKDTLKTFMQRLFPKLPDWLLWLIAVITAIAEFVLFYQGHFALVTGILLAVVWLGCLYVRVAKTDTGVVGGKGIHAYPEARDWALIGISAIPAAVLALVLGLYWTGLEMDGPYPAPSYPSADNLIKYFDFETSAAGWTDIVKWDAQWQNPQTIEDIATFSSKQIERGVAYVLPISAGGWTNYTVQYKETVQADIIVAHLYLPKTSDIEANWVGVAAVRIPNIDEKGAWLASSGRSIPLGEWTQIVLDLRGKYDPDDKQLNSRPVLIEVVYVVEGSSILSSGTVLGGLDEVAWYQATGDESVREQRGAGRTLFDFEDEDIKGWQIVNTRVETDTIIISSERVYRGKWALKWETHLEDASNTSSINIKWSGSPPQSWIANVYLPDNVPAETTMWANFFTYSSSGWEGGNTRGLVKGSWNTLAWDTHDVSWKPGEITIGIHIGVNGGSYQGPIYVDDIQIFEK